MARALLYGVRLLAAIALLGASFVWSHTADAPVTPDRELMAEATAPPSEHVALYSVDFDDGSALGPDGTQVAIDADSTSLTLNLLGHRCIAAGSLRLMTGFIPEVPVP